MTSDGFSVKTTISQIANVARTQVKGQATQPVNPATDKLLKHDKRVDRVKRGEEVQKHKINPDSERKRGREDAEQRMRQGDLPESVAGEHEAPGEALDGDDGGKGVVLDTKA